LPSGFNPFVQSIITILECSMSLQICSDEVIEAVIVAAVGENASARVRYLYRESLRNLVRIAKLEYTAELKRQPLSPLRKPRNATLH